VTENSDIKEQRNGHAQDSGFAEENRRDTERQMRAEKSVHADNRQTTGTGAETENREHRSARVRTETVLIAAV